MLRSHDGNLGWTTVDASLGLPPGSQILALDGYGSLLWKRAPEEARVRAGVLANLGTFGPSQNINLRVWRPFAKVEVDRRMSIDGGDGNETSGEDAGGTATPSYASDADTSDAWDNVDSDAGSNSDAEAPKSHDAAQYYHAQHAYPNNAAHDNPAHDTPHFATFADAGTAAAPPAFAALDAPRAPVALALSRRTVKNCLARRLQQLKTACGCGQASSRRHVKSAKGSWQRACKRAARPLRNLSPNMRKR